MTTISERINFASAMAYDFADVASDQIFALAGIANPVNDETVFKDHSVMIAALTDATAKTYAIERQCESTERIADALRDIADALKGNTAAIAQTLAILDTMAPPRFKGEPCRFVEPGGFIDPKEGGQS